MIVNQFDFIMRFKFQNILRELVDKIKFIADYINIVDYHYDRLFFINML